MGPARVLRFSATFDELGKVARDGAGWHACLDLLDYEVADAGRTVVFGASAGDRSTLVTSITSGPRLRRSGRPRYWERLYGSRDGGVAQ